MRDVANGGVAKSQHHRTRRVRIYTPQVTHAQPSNVIETAQGRVKRKSTWPITLFRVGAGNPSEGCEIEVLGLAMLCRQCEISIGLPDWDGAVPHRSAEVV